LSPFVLSFVDTCKDSEELPEHEVKPLARSPTDVGKNMKWGHCMFILGVSKRSSGVFKPEDGKNEINYDFVKIHVRYEFGVDSDIPDLSVGEPVDVIKVNTSVWSRFLSDNQMIDKDVLGSSVSVLYNKYGKVSGITLR